MMTFNLVERSGFLSYIASLGTFCSYFGLWREDTIPLSQQFVLKGFIFVELHIDEL